MPHRLAYSIGVAGIAVFLAATVPVIGQTQAGPRTPWGDPDPKTWTRPWTFSLPLTADANPLPLYECHEGNYGLKNILSAARAEERAKQ